MFRALLAAFVLCFSALSATAADKEYLVLNLKDGTVVIELFDDVAPGHVARITALAIEGAYDGIAFHRVMDGFMAQTGDVKYGRVEDDGSVSENAGFGGSDLPNLAAEFSDIPFDRGIVGAARGGDDVNSANSQFFIMFAEGHFLNKNYTVWGKVVFGMEYVDRIKRGAPNTGQVTGPDKIIRAWAE